MNEKILNVTLISRHDTEENWKNSSYKPEKGEIIVYDIDNTYNYERFMIGDGIHTVNELPFASYTLPTASQDTLGGAKIYSDSTTLYIET